MIIPEPCEANRGLVGVSRDEAREHRVAAVHEEIELFRLDQVLRGHARPTDLPSIWRHGPARPTAIKFDWRAMDAARIEQ